VLVLHRSEEVDILDAPWQRRRNARIAVEALHVPQQRDMRHESLAIVVDLQTIEHRTDARSNCLKRR